MKFAIIVGHNSESKGMLTYTKEREFDFNLEVAQALKFKYNIPYYLRKPGAGYNHQIDDLVVRLADDDIEVVMELHLNSSMPNAQGAELLINYKQDVPEKERMQYLVDEYCKQANERPRGIKNVRENDRGYYLLDECRKMKMLAYIWEPCFANWKNDGSIFVIEKKMRYIDTIGQLCSKYFMSI